VIERLLGNESLSSFLKLLVSQHPLSVLIVLGGALSIFIAFFVKDSFAQKGVTIFLEWAKGLPYVLGKTFLNSASFSFSHTNKGGLALAGIYGLALFLLLPMTPFNMAAGFLFGVYKGIAAALLGTLLFLFLFVLCSLNQISFDVVVIFLFH